MTEILAPAGDYNTFKTAVDAGADAVYLGLKDFSARKNAGNFTSEELRSAVIYAHTFGVKVYVAVNTLVKDTELDNFLNTVGEALEAGADALIIQDVYLGSLIKKIYPESELHLSTQAGVNNVDGARVAIAHGFSRVVLARETEIAEIEKISRIIETEVFVQGALCSSFSGQCYMSAFAGGNSGNRGLCKQPCRQQYRLDDGDVNYAICLADLKVGTRIAELEKAGVSSFKIEGRMRRAEYVSASVQYYKDVFVAGKEDKLKALALEKTYNRGNYTEGYAFHKKTGIISSAVQGHIGASVGVITEVKGNRITINGYPKPVVGDCFKILREGSEVGSAEVKNRGGSVVIEADGAVKTGDEARITTDVRLSAELLSVKRSIPVDVDVYVAPNSVAVVKIKAGDYAVRVESEEVLPPATGRALTERDIVDNFSKTDKYPFAPIINAHIDGEVFAPKSVVNKLRREAYDRLFRLLTERKKIESTDFKYVLPSRVRAHSMTAVIGEDFYGFDKEIAIFAPSDYNSTQAFSKFFEQTAGVVERYLYLPAYMNTADIALAEARLKGFDGVYSENISGAEFAKRNGVKLFAGTGYNVFNSISAGGVKEEADRFALSKELSEQEARSITLYPEAFVLTRGDIKVMDLIYCPYGGDCAHCKGRDRGELTDYAGRKFPLRRIKMSSCRFEVYNSATLVSRDAERSIYNVVLHNGVDVKSLLNFTEDDLKRSVYKRTGRHRSIN